MVNVYKNEHQKLLKTIKYVKKFIDRQKNIIFIIKKYPFIIFIISPFSHKFYIFYSYWLNINIVKIHIHIYSYKPLLIYFYNKSQMTFN